MVLCRVIGGDDEVGGSGDDEKSNDFEGGCEAYVVDEISRHHDDGSSILNNDGGRW